MTRRTMVPRSVAWGFAMTFMAASPVRAQDAAPSDSAAIWTFQNENAAITTARLTDRYYTNGLRLGFTSATGQVPQPLGDLGRIVFGEGGQQRFSLDLSQQIYTPAATDVAVPPPGDRPYAGVLMATLGLLRDAQTTRSTLSLGLGVVGPWALAEQVQNGIHDIIGQRRDQGWDTQLRNEPAIELFGGRTWREPIGHVFGLESDALLQAAAGLGTVRIYALGGTQLRLGRGLGSDFGVARVHPGLSGGDAFHPTRPVAWYIFVGGDGQAVAHDVTLNGNTWQSSPSVTLDPFVGELQAGFAVMAFGTRLTYTQVFQTQEFRHQKGGLHQLGSLALSIRF